MSEESKEAKTSEESQEAPKAKEESQAKQTETKEESKSEKTQAKEKPPKADSEEKSEDKEAKTGKSEARDKPDAKKEDSDAKKEDKSDKEEEEGEIIEVGKISRQLTQDGFEHESLGIDHLGVEILKVEREFLIPFATALYAYGFNYLQCQGGYDDGPGKDLVSAYHLTKLTDNGDRPEEVRIKVFLPRADPKVASVFWIWKTADWQERETYDMYGIIYEGHPNLKRLLMPEDWVGWPMRKDYISPDFYELQDAY